MTLFPRIFKDDTILKLLKITEHEVAKNLFSYKQYRNSYKRKLKSVHKFMKDGNKENYRVMEREIREINLLIVLDLRLEEEQVKHEKIAQKNVETAIEQESDSIIRAKLIELKDDLIQLYTLIEQLKPILLKQLEFIDKHKEDLTKQFDIKGLVHLLTEEMLNLLVKESYALYAFDKYTKPEKHVFNKIMLELMDIIAFEKTSEENYKLPVDFRKIQRLGLNPLLRTTSHGKNLKYAWDFAVLQGTEVKAAMGGRVVYVNVKSNLQMDVTLLYLILGKHEGPFVKYLNKKGILKNRLLKLCPPFKATFEEGKIKKAMQEITSFYEDNDNRIVIRHKGGKFSGYNHLMQGGSAVTEGNKVIKGQLIGFSGNSGLSTQPHLHFEVFVPKLGCTESGAIHNIEKRKTIHVKFEK